MGDFTEELPDQAGDRHPVCEYRAPLFDPDDVTEIAVRCVGITAIATAACFLLPFVLFYLSHRMYPGDPEAGFSLLLPSLFLWLISLVTGLFGIMAGAHALRHGCRRSWVIAATVMNGVPLASVVLLIILYIVGANMHR